MTTIGPARKWVYELPPDTLFRSCGVPGDPSTRNETLCRLAAGGNTSIIERIGTGLYYKRAAPRR